MAMDFVDLLKMCVEQKGSDIFITAGAAPSIKVNGVINPVTEKPLNPEAARKVVYDIMNDKQRSEFEQTSECNFAISAAPSARPGSAASASMSSSSAAMSVWCCAASRPPSRPWRSWGCR